MEEIKASVFLLQDRLELRLLVCVAPRLALLVGAIIPDIFEWQHFPMKVAVKASVRLVHVQQRRSSNETRCRSWALACLQICASVVQNTCHENYVDEHALLHVLQLGVPECTTEIGLGDLCENKHESVEEAAKRK